MPDLFCFILLNPNRLEKKELIRSNDQFGFNIVKYGKFVA